MPIAVGSTMYKRTALISLIGSCEKRPTKAGGPRNAAAETIGGAIEGFVRLGRDVEYRASPRQRSPNFGARGRFSDHSLHKQTPRSVPASLNGPRRFAPQNNGGALHIPQIILIS